MQEAADHRRHSDAEANADEPSDDRERHGFEEELNQNVMSFCADRHANADLARSLRHADEHDVHDADAADEQRHGGDHEQQIAQDSHRLRLRLRDLFLRSHLKIGVAVRADAMTLSQH